MRSRSWLRWIGLTLVLALLGASLSVSVVAAAPRTQPSLQDVDEPEEEDDEVSDFCAEPDYLHPVGGFQHPVGARLSHGDADYETVMAWFCEGQGFGQIMLALATASAVAEDPDSLLDRRSGGEGWGEIWQDLGLIGRGRQGQGDADDGDSIDEEPDTQGPPDHAGPKIDGEDDEAGGGPPPWAGPPDHARSRRNRP